MEDAIAIANQSEEHLESGNIVSKNDGSESHDLPRSLSFYQYLYQPPLRKPKDYPAMQTVILAFQSLGIVYGDLGTSPLYVFSSIRLSNPGEEDLLGLFSLIFCTLTSIALIKYVFIVLRADDHGEVLSALQGIESVSSKITQKHVIILAVALLLVLFIFQQCGTSKVSFSFSPIMLMWFLSNAAIGIYNIIRYEPTIFKALSPHYIIKFFQRNGRTGWEVLGAVFLCITGAEAMFADLGHFTERAIQLAFSSFVYPALVLTYAGEAAYLIKHPDKMGNAFYSSVPKPVYWPMFVISTLAAIVASQSVISASFSIVKQSLALDCFPRVNMVHTSSKHEGQVYSPEINYTIMIICIALVVGFREGVELRNAFGKPSCVAVVWVMIITTCLITLVMLVIWDTNLLLICAFFLPFVTIEGIYMTSLLIKIPQGGWIPFAISVFFLIIMLSWTCGRSKKSIYEAERKISLGELGQILSSNTVYRTPGICFFYTDLVNGISPIIRHYIQHTNSVREIMVIVTVRTVPIRSVLPEERFIMGKLAVDGVYRCLVQFGYKDSPSMEKDDYVASVVAKLCEHVKSTEKGQKLDAAMKNGAVFVMGRTILKANKNNRWFARFTIDYLYRFFQKNCRSAVSTLGGTVPLGKTMQVGMLYEI